MDVLRAFEEWYEVHCNGDWEHAERIRIFSLDNPGWALAIHLDAEELEHAAEGWAVEYDRSEDDWVSCRVRRGVREGWVFEGAGGPRKLRELMRVFLELVSSYGRSPGRT